MTAAVSVAVAPQHVKTRAHALADLAIKQLHDAPGMVMVHGESGTGKSEAVEQIVGEAGLPAGWMAVPPVANYKRTLQRLLEALTGLPAQGTATELELQLTDIVLAGPRLLVVDKAERISAMFARMVCDLRDLAGSQLSTVLIGDTSDVLVRFEFLRTRVTRRIRFERLAGDEIGPLLAQLHPMYVAAPAALINAVDDEFAQGLLAHWASFTKDAVALMSRHDIKELTEEVVTNVLTHQGVTSV